MKNRIIDTDVLIIGGGTAGCFAGITLGKKKDLDVLIVEKANIVRSGCLAAGVNAINAYITKGRVPQDYVDYCKKDADGIYTYTSKKIKDDTIKAAMADGESVSEFTLERAVDESSTSTGNAAANTSASTAAGSATTTASDSSSAEQNSVTADTTLTNNSNSASDSAEE